MNNHRNLKRLLDIVKHDLGDLQNNAIFYETDHYSVFGQYKIYPQDTQVVVYHYGTDPVGTFSKTQAATAWCVAKKYNQHRLAAEIEKLDRDVIRLQQDISTSKKLLKRIKASEPYYISLIKFENKKARLESIHDHLSKCIERAKYFQIRGFNNEIERAQRPAQNRTSFQGTGKPHWSSNRH